MFRKLHPSNQSVTISIDGVAIAAEAGESLAAVPHNKFNTPSEGCGRRCENRVNVSV